MEHLAPAEGEQLPGQAGRSLGGQADLFQLLAVRALDFAVQDQVAEAQDWLERTHPE
jgi:hypothetical protein